MLTALDGEDFETLPRIDGAHPGLEQDAAPSKFTEPGMNDESSTEDLADGSPTPSVLVVIDGWEALYETLLRINNELGIEQMLTHVATAHLRGRRLVIASKLVSLLETRIVLCHHDASDYSIAGLRPAQVPAKMPPGRGLVLPHAHAVQFMALRRVHADD